MDAEAELLEELKPAERTEPEDPGGYRFAAQIAILQALAMPPRTTRRPRQTPQPDVGGAEASEGEAARVLLQDAEQVALDPLPPNRSLRSAVQKMASSGSRSATPRKPRRQPPETSASKAPQKPVLLRVAGGKARSYVMSRTSIGDKWRSMVNVDGATLGRHPVHDANSGRLLDHVGVAQLLLRHAEAGVSPQSLAALKKQWLAEGQAT